MPGFLGLRGPNSFRDPPEATALEGHAMSEHPSASSLHLQDLVITGFRGIRALSVDRLGRVTLLAGKNGVGKTTVLEAVRVFAARGRDSVLSEVLQQRDEVVVPDDDDHRMTMPDFTALFYGRDPGSSSFSLGPTDPSQHVRVEETDLPDELGSLLERLVPDSALNGPIRGLRSVFRGVPRFFPVVTSGSEGDTGVRYSWATPHTARILRRALDEGKYPGAISCLSLGPGVLPNDEIARYWDAIALTPHETAALDALRLVMGERVQDVTVVGDGGRLGPTTRRSTSVRPTRKAIVKLRGFSHPVPLKSLGDGAVRLFGVALALANSQDGFLLIDEVENGIHHTLQADFWRMVLAAAQANRVQVLATTHSFDCVRGFAEASTEVADAASALVRLVRRDEETWAVEYSEKDLRIAAEQAIEVR